MWDSVCVCVCVCTCVCLCVCVCVCVQSVHITHSKIEHSSLKVMTSTRTQFGGEREPCSSANSSVPQPTEYNYTGTAWNKLEKRLGVEKRAVVGVFLEVHT